MPSPPLHPPFSRPGLIGRRGKKQTKQKNKQTSTKAACSNRLLPKGCHGNSGKKGKRRLSGEREGGAAGHGSPRVVHKEVRGGDAGQVVDMIWGGEARKGQFT